MTFLQRWWLRSIWHRLELRGHVPQLLKKSPEPFRGEVLEVGAGVGTTSRLILETFPQVELTATDIDATATAAFENLAQQYGARLKVHNADLMHLPFDRNAFDFVIAINIFNFLSAEEISTALLQCLRVVRPGGLIGISKAGLLLPAGTSRQTIIDTLEKEKCVMMVSEGNNDHILWFRSPYPVEGGVTI